MIALLQPLAAHAEHHPMTIGREIAGGVILVIVLVLIGFAVSEVRRAPEIDEDDL